MLTPIVAALALLATPAPAQTRIEGHGQIAPTPAHAANRPDPALRYRVVFSITKSAGKASERDPSLEKVARFLNLLAESKIVPGPGDVVPIVHGGATPIVLGAAGYAKRNEGRANPDADLIARLKAAGAPVHVCAQALAGFGIAIDEVDPNVVVDVSALTTITTLQLKGYALFPD